MTLALRELLPHLGAGSRVWSRRVRITAAADDRADLLIVLVGNGRWSLFDPNTIGLERLGEIVEDREGWFVAEIDGPGRSYRFAEFRQALSYFMEYGFALSLCQDDS